MSSERVQTRRDPGGDVNAYIPQTHEPSSTASTPLINPLPFPSVTCTPHRSLTTCVFTQRVLQFTPITSRGTRVHGADNSSHDGIMGSYIYEYIVRVCVCAAIVLSLTFPSLSSLFGNYDLLVFAWLTYHVVVMSADII